MPKVAPEHRTATYAATCAALGFDLRAERLRRGIGGRALARMLGIGRETLQNIETGRNHPGIPTLLLLRIAFGARVAVTFEPAASVQDRLARARAQTLSDGKLALAHPHAVDPAMVERAWLRATSNGDGERCRGDATMPPVDR